MKNLVVVVCLFFFQIGMSQASSETQTVNDTIYTEKQVDIKPQPPGGKAKYCGEFAKRFSIPENYNGKIYVNFVVEKDGSLSDIKVKNGDKNLTAQVQKILERFPKWTPGQYKEKIVRVSSSIPIVIHQLNSKGEVKSAFDDPFFKNENKRNGY
ncbi:energy transducer TonB [Flavobacterium faecale]|uniref:energy transducer TonB n=1 Tax=Flavobacterium faecale TaxID=1355330 RepID=UPI003AAE5420